MELIRKNSIGEVTGRLERSAEWVRNNATWMARNGFEVSEVKDTVVVVEPEPAVLEVEVEVEVETETKTIVNEPAEVEAEEEYKPKKRKKK